MTEWYRTADWHADARADFERRLSRARGQRSEYLRIKAVSLHDAGLLDAAVVLYERHLSEHPDAVNSSVHELLADIARAQGRLEEAARRYRELLRTRPLPDSSGMLEVSLAEVLLELGQPDAAAACLEEVDVEAVATLDSTHFRFLLTSARTAAARGDAEGAASDAAQALGLVGRAPRFPRHPTVGLVQRDDVTLARLRALASPSRLHSRVDRRGRLRRWRSGR